jgi:hypothetical protein
MRRLALFLFPLSFLLAQQTADITVDATLVVIPVTVTDPVNRFVLGLDKKDFSLFEDDKEQTVVHFPERTRLFRWDC